MLWVSLKLNNRVSYNTRSVWCVFRFNFTKIFIHIFIEHQTVNYLRSEAAHTTQLKESTHTIWWKYNCVPGSGHILQEKNHLRNVMDFRHSTSKWIFKESHSKHLHKRRKRKKLSETVWTLTNMKNNKRCMSEQNTFDECAARLIKKTCFQIEHYMADETNLNVCTLAG